jgi:hypothetical protein
MSILQTTLSDAALKERVAVEWPGYIKACAEIAERHGDPGERALRRKRYKAMKYLGDAACTGRTAYKKTESRIFTPEFVSELEAQNSKARVRRNPWLDSRMNDKGLGKSGAENGNVLPFGPQIAVSDVTNQAAI